MKTAAAHPGISPRQIQLRGVHVHNLKNIDVDIPLNQLVVVSGVSGSGKSSLAFDTLVAEGQRRYLETFSVSARQHLERVEKPNADLIAHVPVAISIRSDQSQRTNRDPRSTVGSVADLLDGLRFLFARIGKVVCLDCGCKVSSHSPSDLARHVAAQPPGTRCTIGFIDSEKYQADRSRYWLAKGFSRSILDGRTCDLNSLTVWPKAGEIRIVVDRFAAGKVDESRVTESAETAFREGNGRCWLLTELAEPSEHRLTIDGRNWQEDNFHRKLECSQCGRAYLPPEPRLFSHFSVGGCEACNGTGINSTGETCNTCSGRRFRDEALAVRIDGKSIADLCSLQPPKLLEFIRGLQSSLTADRERAALPICNDLIQRLNVVSGLGLDYLTLDRASETLSGGECRRLMLAAVIGSRVTGTLIVIDEPSEGLHATEIPRIIAALRQLISFHNSVIAVDHAPRIAASADYLIELGPAAGPNGGRIVYQGPPQTDAAPKTPRPEKPVEKTSVPKFKRTTAKLVVSQIGHPSFKDRQFEFPLGRLCVISGPSGSGKTTLLTQVIYANLCRKLGLAIASRRQLSAEINGGDKLVDVVLVDQSPLTRSIRSNPATWLGIFAEIRQTFATATESRFLGVTARDFSFNSPHGGRCKSCSGTGVLKHDMQFLADVTLPCPECRGSRYGRQVLQVKYRGRSIADVLAMTVSEAATFFRTQSRIQHKLQMLTQFGLDYVVLGQPSGSLSGGEVQRLKLAAFLGVPNRGPCLFLCDEPTNGLHPKDVGHLVTGFRELRASGHSLILADNSPELISAADFSMELSLTVP